MADERSLSPSPERPPGGPELRLLDRRAFVGFPPLDVAPGVVVTDFALQVPDVTFPFNVTGGASRFQRQKLLFGELEVTVSAEVLRRRMADAAGRAGGLSDVALHLRAGYLEGEAKLAAAGGAPVSFKVALDGLGPDLGAWVYDVRLYAPAATPAAAVPALIARALVELDVLPGVRLRGASGFTARVLPRLSDLAAVSRGFKAPDVERAQLSHVEVTPSALVLRFTASGIPPTATPDESLLLQLEGTRAFAGAESLLAEGRWDEARQAWLRAGDVADAHPFAVERLLQLLVADPAAEALALDVAELLAARRPKAAAPLWAEAVLRERRGERAAAAGRYLALALHARAAGELASAFLAAEASARAAAGVAPGVAVRALHELLGLRPDHLPALLALARAADASGDRASSLRAWRRVSALARDVRVAAEAHVQLARLSAAGAPSELSAARLHCEAALRLQPDLPDALHLLGELCLRAGDPLRALRALDRLREVALGQHALEQVADASLLAGRAWETGPGQLDNALLRYREVLSLRPADVRAALGVARVSERLGRWQEALAAAQQVVELAGPEPAEAATRQAAHEAWHVLARLYEGQLREPGRAREALAAALALDARDAAALSVLVPAFRAEGRAAELADALEKLARLPGDAAERAALAVEAGELYRVRLGRLDAAARLYGLALEAQPRQRVALEGVLAVAEATRDGEALCRALRELSAQEPAGPARNRLLRRLAAAARDLSGDLATAAQALSELLLHEPLDLTALGEMKELLRRRGEVAKLSDVLAARARAAEQLGDVRLAAAALRELAELQATRLGDRAAAAESLARAVRLLPEAA
ncbi:MAG: flagellar hook-length control protein FliK, partial [Deltaproteobacteria bacterium]|nr:flagellar hook-length control protein FliK [Deltaproteobacteria bacterium]